MTRPSALLAAALLLAASTLPARAQQVPPPLDTPTFIVPALKPDHPLRILVYGDTRFTDPSNTSDTNPRVRKWLAEKVAQEHPDIMLTTGDIPFGGSNSADWQVFHREAASWWTEHLRVYPTLGNHEIIPNGPQGRFNYFKNFPQVHHHPWYSALLGNVFLINLDSTSPMWPNCPQADWLRSQLNHIPPQTDFVFFLTHVPLIADVQSEFIAGIPSPEGVALRRYLEARALTAPQKFIVINGHIHTYERFEVNGVTHIISGGGGAKPYPVYLRGPQDQYQDPGFPVFNYVIFEIDGKHASAKMYKIVDPNAPTLSVQVKDTFTEDAH
jgi:hypothetical protein